MRFYNGLWYYRGKAYATLHDALLAAWPKWRCKNGQAGL